MRMRTRTVFVTIALALAISLLGAPSQAKTIKLTIVAGHPPVFTWVSVARDFFIPEVDKRLAEAGGAYTIKWNQAYGGTIAKAGGVLEAVQDGIADVGVVGTIFEASKMPLHNVTYMTPFGSGDILTVLDTIGQLKSDIPAVGKEWTKHNLVPLGGFALDTYGVLTNFPVKTVDDLKGHKIAAPGPSANPKFRCG
jgi:TRAP-type C4-dicarboxylate transport system substrate-binding protein